MAEKSSATKSPLAQCAMISEWVHVWELIVFPLNSTVMVRTQYVWEHVQHQKDMLFIFNHFCVFYSCLQPCAVTMEMAAEGPSAKSLLVTVFLLLRRISAILDIKTVHHLSIQLHTHAKWWSFSVKITGQNKSLVLKR